MFQYIINLHIMEQKSYYKNWYALTDNAIVETLCKSIKQMRLNKNISQEELSENRGSIESRLAGWKPERQSI
jgi:hypothetical protein